jgi:hypothetical protein
MATVQEPGGLSEAEKRRIKAEVEYRKSLEKKKSRFSLTNVIVAVLCAGLGVLILSQCVAVMQAAGRR